MPKLFNTKMKSNDDRERSFLFHSCTNLCSVNIAARKRQHNRVKRGRFTQRNS